MATTTTSIGQLSQNVTGCTGNGVSPIVLTLNALPASVMVGQTILVASVGGNTNANGTKVITVVDYALKKVTFAGTGNANYTSGGTVARNYATIALWKVGTGGALGANDVRVGELCDDADFDLSGSPADLTINDATGTSATSYRVLRAWRNTTTGFTHRYDPISREGVRLLKQINSTFPFGIKVSEEFFRLEGLYVELVDLGVSSGGPYSAVEVTVTNCWIDACFCRSDAINSTSLSVYGVYHSAGTLTATATANLLVTNTVVVGSGVANLGAVNGFKSTRDFDRFYNCVAYRCHGGAVFRGFNTTGANQAARNCVALECSNLAVVGSADFAVSGTCTFTHCISSDTSSSANGGVGSYQGETAFGVFVYAEYDDFRVLQTSKALDFGVSLASTFTTDIDGATRTGLWEIGCYNGFGAPPSEPPTVVDETVGTASRDYATLDAWKAATNLHLVYRNEVRRALVYADSTFTPASGFILDGAVTDRTRFREVVAVDRYNHRVGTGVKISSSGGTDAVELAEDYARLSGVYVENTVAGSSNRSCVRVSGRACVVDGLVGKLASGTAGTRPVVASTGEDARVRNVLALGNSNTDGADFGVLATGARSRVQNCAAAKIRRGSTGTCFSDGGAGGVVFENCVAGSSDVGFAVEDGGQRYNASIDSTAAGTRSITGITAADVWVDSTNDDFRLAAGSPLVNAGVRLAREFTTDIDGTTRGGAWEIGPYDGYLVPAEYRVSKLTTTCALATCWSIERADGFTLQVTDHSTPLVHKGVLFVPVGGFTASAQRREGDLKQSNLEISGPLSDDGVALQDLVARLFDAARVRMYVVDPRVPFTAPVRSATYFVQEVKFDGEHWTAQLGGMTSRLLRQIGLTYSRTCQNVLGDEVCRKDLQALTRYDVAVTSVTDDRLEFAASGLPSGGVYVDDYFKYGVVTWKTGDNVGLRHEVRAYDATGKVLKLALEAEFVVQVGDTFDLTPGDDRSIETCFNKFDNVEHFVGFPNAPGSDLALQTPQQ